MITQVSQEAPRVNTRRYLFKLYPTPDHAALLHDQRKMMADLWNALKQRCEDTYRRERKSLSFFDMTNEITELRHECPEWAELPAITAHRVAKQLVDAYQAFFRRVKAGGPAGYPKWHRREDAGSIPLGTMLKTGWRLSRDEASTRDWWLHYGGATNSRDSASWIRARGCIPALDRAVGATGLSRRNYRADNPAKIAVWRNADILWRDRRWWLSVCVDIEDRHKAGRRPVTVAFDLLDALALVDGHPESPAELETVAVLGERIDRLKAERDERWPRQRRRTDAERDELRDANAEIGRLYAIAARKRCNALHVWTSQIIARASDLTIIAPPVQEETATPRGDVRNWGAQVATVSELNRHVLSQAPAMAIAMLKYKAEEAGIRCDVVSDVAPKVAVGKELVQAGRQVRRARRELRRAA